MSTMMRSCFGDSSRAAARRSRVRRMTPSKLSRDSSSSGAKNSDMLRSFRTTDSDDTCASASHLLYGRNFLHSTQAFTEGNTVGAHTSCGRHFFSGLAQLSPDRERNVFLGTQARVRVLPLLRHRRTLRAPYIFDFFLRHIIYYIIKKGESYLLIGKRHACHTNAFRAGARNRPWRPERLLPKEWAGSPSVSTSTHHCPRIKPLKRCLDAWPATTSPWAHRHQRQKGSCRCIPGDKRGGVCAVMRHFSQRTWATGFVRRVNVTRSIKHTWASGWWEG